MCFFDYLYYILFSANVNKIKSQKPLILLKYCSTVRFRRTRSVFFAKKPPAAQLNRRKRFLYKNNQM